MDLKAIKNLPGHPRIEDLILLYEAYTELRELENSPELRSHPKKPTTLADVCARLGRNPQHFYHRLAGLNKLFGKPIFDTTPGSGTTVEDTEVFEQIERFFVCYQQLFIPENSDDTLAVNLAAPQVLSARVLPRPLDLFRSRDCVDTHRQVQINLLCEDSAKIREQVRVGAIDYGLTSVPADYECDGTRVDEVASAIFHRCILCPSGHPLGNLTRRLSWDDFRNETVVIYRQQGTPPEIPWNLLTHYARRTVTVDTILEAHGYALAGGALALSYRELLSQQEEKYLGIRELPEEADTETKVCLLRSQRSWQNWSAEKRSLMQLLELRLKKHLQDIEVAVIKNREITKTVGEYRSLWYARLGSEVESSVRRWTPAALSHVWMTPGGYIRATARRSNAPDDEGQAYEIIGRVKLSDQMWHLICRGVLIDSGRHIHSSASFLYQGEDLGNECIVGTFAERHPHHGLDHGLLILHKSDVPSIPSGRELNQAVKEFARKHPLYCWIKNWELPRSAKLGEW
ncbi:MAG: hypothetical protein KDA93_16855 [Planctomycetaceae bacterium]|nr:hypothetical protein [Planctomycetaceae bacterium]